jgi:hypothetical protein
MLVPSVEVTQGSRRASRTKKESAQEEEIMSTHIADIPKPFYCYVRNEFLYDMQKGHGEFTPCMVYGLSSLPGRAWGLSLLLNNGAMVQHVPVHAITFDPSTTHNHPLDHLQIWSCYGWDFVTHEYDALKEMPVKVYMKGQWEIGRYIFTAAPYDDHFAMCPDQHKHFNFVQLECGALGAFPGNRMLVFDSSFVEFEPERPSYITNTQYWYVENIEDDPPFDDVINHTNSL